MTNVMRVRILSVLLIVLSSSAGAQELSIFDGRYWGIVLEHQDMKKVVVKPDIPYLQDQKGTLRMDVYLPPDLQPDEVRPAIVFLNAVGDRPNEMKVKSWGTYRTWPMLVAAHGYIGISMESDGSRIPESLAGIFSFIDRDGKAHHIDRSRLGVYAASANVTSSIQYLMQPGAYPGIKAAVLYYGRQPSGPFRKDLPVLFVVPEGDVRGNGFSTLWNEVLKNNAPWTITMGSGLIHAFDSFNDNDDSRKMIKETISFWKNQLDPIPQHHWPNSVGRETLAALYGHDDAKAASLLKTWTDTHPTDGPAMVQYGSVLKNLARKTEAEEVLKKAIALQPDNGNAKANLIAVYYALGKDDDARKLDAVMAKAGQATRNTYASIGYSLFVLNRHREGVQYFEKIPPADRLSWDYYNLGCGYARLNQKDKAYNALNQAVAMGNTSKQQYENDDDLNSLRSDQEYRELMSKLQ